MVSEKEERRHRRRRYEDLEFDTEARRWLKIKIENEKRNQRIADSVKSYVIGSLIIAVIGAFVAWKYSGG